MSKLTKIILSSLLALSIGYCTDNYLEKSSVETSKLKYFAVKNFYSWGEDIEKNKCTEKLKTDIYKDMDYKEVIKEIDTPKKAVIYLNTHLKYDFKKSGYNSFKVAHESGKSRCFEYAISAAAILRDDLCPEKIPGPAILIMGEKGKKYHAIYVLKKNDRWGFVKKYSYSAPKYKTIEELVRKNFKERHYINYELRYLHIYDDLNIDWVASEKDLREQLKEAAKKGVATIKTVKDWF